jgi:hypothetical protein
MYLQNPKMYNLHKEREVRMILFDVRYLQSPEVKSQYKKTVIRMFCFDIMLSIQS